MPIWCEFLQKGDLIFTSFKNPEYAGTPFEGFEGNPQELLKTAMNSQGVLFCLGTGSNVGLGCESTEAGQTCNDSHRSEMYEYPLSHQTTYSFCWFHCSNVRIFF